MTKTELEAAAFDVWYLTFKKEPTFRILTS